MAPVTPVNEVFSHGAPGEFVAGIGTLVDLMLRTWAGARTCLLYDTSITKITLVQCASKRSWSIEFRANGAGLWSSLPRSLYPGVGRPGPTKGLLGNVLVNDGLPRPLVAIVTEEREEDFVFVELRKTI